MLLVFFFFKQKTAYEMRISDWSSDVCSSDLVAVDRHRELLQALKRRFVVALEVGFGTGLVLALRIQEHDLAAQLALVLLDVGLALEFDRDRLALDRAVGTWRPGLGSRPQRQRARRQKIDVGLAERPPEAA